MGWFLTSRLHLVAVSMVVLLHYRSGLTFMGQALQGTPAAWVRLEKDAQAPISRDKQEVTTEVGDKKTYRAALH